MTDLEIEVSDEILNLMWETGTSISNASNSSLPSPLHMSWEFFEEQFKPKSWKERVARCCRCCGSR
jgi:hypothetical protein